MLDVRYSHLYFYQSLNRLQHGLSAIAELLVLSCDNMLHFSTNCIVSGIMDCRVLWSGLDMDYLITGQHSGDRKLGSVYQVLGLEHPTDCHQYQVRLHSSIKLLVLN